MGGVRWEPAATSLRETPTGKPYGKPLAANPAVRPFRVPCGNQSKEMLLVALLALTRGWAAKSSDEQSGRPPMFL